MAGGSAELVCKISDSYLGIGDKILNRGADFSTREEVESLLRADPAYAGKAAVISELIRPAEGLGLASAGYGAVHSLDIITMRTREGVRVLTVLLTNRCYPDDSAASKSAVHSARQRFNNAVAAAVDAAAANFKTGAAGAVTETGGG